LTGSKLLEILPSPAIYSFNPWVTLLMSILNISNNVLIISLLLYLDLSKTTLLFSSNTINGTLPPL
jgi:hypothetical protein